MPYSPRQDAIAIAFCIFFLQHLVCAVFFLLRASLAYMIAIVERHYTPVFTFFSGSVQPGLFGYGELFCRHVDKC